MADPFVDVDRRLRIRPARGRETKEGGTREGPREMTRHASQPSSSKKEGLGFEARNYEQRGQDSLLRLRPPVADDEPCPSRRGQALACLGWLGPAAHHQKPPVRHLSCHLRILVPACGVLVRPSPTHARQPKEAPHLICPLLTKKLHG